jgi:prepilin-type N-terminal cleavage/methylation domain-containing protein
MSMHRTRCRHAGVTLVELLVALVILGLVAGVAGLAAPPVRRPSAGDVTRASIAQARRSALVSGQPVTTTILAGGQARVLTALPDGEVIADSSLSVDRLAGVVDGAATVPNQAR